MSSKMLFTATHYKLACLKASQRVGRCCPDGVLLAWHRDPRLLTERARRSRGRSILLCCHNHTSPVSVRRVKQLQVSTYFVLTSLSSPVIPAHAAFVVTMPLILRPFLYPQCLRILGFQVFCIFHYSVTLCPAN